MPTVTYADGIPCWVDLATPDVEATAAFYGALFGWEADAPGDPEQTGGYTMFRKDGKLVAACMPRMQAEQPIVWSTYFWADDLDATAAKVADAGGQTIVAPMDVMDAGRMAFFIDTGGAAFGCWQPGQHRGAELANEPGAFCWNELNTRDMDGAKPFYQAVFGLRGVTSQNGPMEYTEWHTADDRVVAGGMTMPPMVPADVPPHWLVYFAVADADASLAKIAELGGRAIMGPMDIPAGRFAVVADAHGAPFAIIALSGDAM